MLTTFAVSGYRSLVDIVMPVDRLTVICGANGSGKSNLYRSLRLLAAVGTGEIVGAIAREGGLASVLWAGPENPRGSAGAGSLTRAPRAQGSLRIHPHSLRIGFGSDEFGYLTDLGLPQIDPGSRFRADPEVKREQVFVGAHARPSSVFVDRTRSATRVRDGAGSWHQVGEPLGPGQSVLLDLEEATVLPEMLRVRQRLQQWRFYDHLRTDRAAPARVPQVGTRTRWLSDDGADLAAVWATAAEAGADQELTAAVDDAFPGSRVTIEEISGVFHLALHQPGLLRPMSAAELSDGTLRYLLLCAALLPSEPPPLIVVNEPESSLHESLLPALAELILAAARRTQVIVVTHATELQHALERAGAGSLSSPSVSTIALTSPGTGTEILGQGILDAPRWEWPSR